MRAIIWTELRENLKWAVLVLIITWLAVAIALTFREFMEYKPANFWFGPGNVGFTLGAALGGLLLGIFQVVFESGKNSWAFLVHRPLSRTGIFLAKAISGLGLLYLAAGTPLFFMALCGLTGHWAAPFSAAMALPAVLDILSGAVYYFAGMMIALRCARWYGSRLPLPDGTEVFESAGAGR